jgi:hypothetical protein
MTTAYRIIDTDGDLTSSQRVARAAAALVMLIYPMVTVTSPLGFIVLLPLIAIYPMFTAIVGWDPVGYVFASIEESDWISKTVARVGLGIVGTGLILATMLVSVNPLGGFAILALLGIAPIFLAIFGENPIKVLFESRETKSDSDQYFDQGQVSDDNEVVGYSANNAEFEPRKVDQPSHHEAA